MTQLHGPLGKAFKHLTIGQCIQTSKFMHDLLLTFKQLQKMKIKPLAFFPIIMVPQSLQRGEAQNGMERARTRVANLERVLTTTTAASHKGRANGTTLVVEEDFNDHTAKGMMKKSITVWYSSRKQHVIE